MVRDIVSALADLKEKEALKIVQERLSAGDDPLSILEDTKQAMGIIGKRFETREYFIPDLVYSGEILKEITKMVKLKLPKTAQDERPGKVIIGTVAGDIHDIGKNIVTFMLDINGFEVYDLGVDLPAQKFVEKIKETDANIVGLSGFLTLVFDSMKETIEAIKAAGLRDRVKIMVGGGLIDDEIRKYTGADAYGRDAIAAVSLARKWVGGK
ncbi:MAG: methionine synthase [Dehalococcoidales bacterium]|jgi:5-methyltetrahydrofolate--homocysteine methyltransferase|nr:methionine synthase [Dehalococcoidales bacterium]|tara:strand:- start:1731 stop:2363 length:633 start_codon:yes stop_codon:yes gene_type:complete